MEDQPRRDFIKRIALGAAVAVPAATLGNTAAAEAVTKDARSIPFFNVMDFGAVGNGKKICTAAIQKAVDSCALAGGGKVVVPAGRFVTGPIFLKSHIEVEVLAGATLAFTTDFDSVPSVPGRWEGIARHVYASLFTGTELEDVSIAGRGTLDGQGEAWWKAFRAVRELRRKMGIEEREPENPPGSPLKWARPRLINLYGCKNVHISGLTLVNSPSWNVHPVLCENVLIDGVTILAPGAEAPNTDGIDPDSCKHVRIANCYISVGDDCIIVKSGYRFQEHGVPSEDIVITNCEFGRGHCGVGVGSETSGGVKNVVISNCVCDGTDRGLRFKTARGRGNSVENVRATNFVMRNVGEAVTVTMFYSGGDRHTPQPINQGTPAFRNFHFSEIIAAGVKQAALIEGLPEMPIEGLSLSNLVVEGAAQGISCVNVRGVTFDNVVVNAAAGPAWNVENVTDLELYRCTSRTPKSGEPVVRLQGVNQAVVQSCTAAEGTGAFLELNGPANRDVTLMSNRLSQAAREVEFVGGATEAALIRRA